MIRFHPPILSLCIPTWNRSAELGRLLASILPQAGPAVEVVVADNASTDDTGRTVRRFRRQAMCRVRSTRSLWNRGLDRNVLRAVGHATGQYVWLVGSDDELTPGAIARVLDTIEAAPNALILGERSVMGHDLVTIRSESFTDWPDRSVHWLDAPGSVATYLSRARSICAALSFLSCTVLPRRAWPAGALTAPWIGSAYLHLFAAWRALLSGTVPVAIRRRELVRCRIGNPQRRDAETAQHVDLDVRTFRRLALMQASRVDAEAVRAVLRLEYPPERLASLDDRLARTPSWPFIRSSLLAMWGPPC